MGPLKTLALFLFAPLIIISTPSAALTIGEPFDLSASLSNLVASASYNFKIRLGSSSGSMNRGQTLISINGTNSWLGDTDSWSSFPVIFMDAFGTWNGTVTGRPGDNAFSGQNFLTLRLRRTDQTSYCCDSASVTATVSSAPVTTNPVITVEAQKPVIEFNPPAVANLGESFKATANLKSFAANTEFYLKIRDKVQTKNGNNFLSDNEAWSLFPLIKTDNSGNWSGEIWSLASENKDEGIYKIKLRVKKKDTDSFFESDTKDIKLIKIVMSLVATPEAIIASRSPEINFVLGTKSASLSALPLKQKEKNFDKLSLIILISGGIFSLAGVWGIIRKK
ncbi:hypothetical protein HY085_02435 [Candidatus Gottesmanbacteria bacterium]|nr:hypothetical protein [Candidatus Gottesmanbacteria bacterium]